MPDVINANGLTVKTAAEITADLVTGMQAIYGSEINVSQNSPDGQMIGIVTQLSVDIRELAVSINNGFDPDQALGVILDQRVTYNNIERAGGTYTIQPIDITASGTIALQGLDVDFDSPNGTGYTVQDAAGNQFILIDSATITAGLTTLNFRARNIGVVNVPVNTITSPVTVVLGVTVINNSVGALSVGQQQETDPQLRTRRQQSVALSTTGYLNGLLGAILNLDGVTEAQLYENDTGVTDSNGIPDHCIWLVVSGGSSSDIANTIYQRKSYGCNIKGDIVFPITTPSGVIFYARWDTPVSEQLWIKFNIQTTSPGFGFDLGSIATFIVNNQNYTIGQFAETSSITDIAAEAIVAQGGGGVAVAVMISKDNITYTDFLDTDTLASEFVLDTSRIAITVLT